MGNDFRICLRLFLNSQLLPYLFMVLNYPVVDKSDVLPVIDMRVCVCIVNSSVCGPSGVAYANISVRYIIYSLFYPAFTLLNLQGRISYSGDSRRIISPVLEFLKSLMDYLTSLVISPVTNYAADNDPPRAVTVRYFPLISMSFLTALCLIKSPV